MKISFRIGDIPLGERYDLWRNEGFDAWVLLVVEGEKDAWCAEHAAHRSDLQNPQIMIDHAWRLWMAADSLKPLDPFPYDREPPPFEDYGL